MSLEQIKAFFHEADKDGSGTLSYQELSSALRSRGYTCTERELKGMFEAADTSGDDQISLDEYLTVMGQAPSQMHKEATLRRTFLMFDKDKNGQIDVHELDLVFREVNKYFSKEELDKMMKQVDNDKSGTISYEEFIKFFFNK